MLRRAATTARTFSALHACTAPRRLLGTGYTGPREAGYDDERTAGNGPRHTVLHAQPAQGGRYGNVLQVIGAATAGVPYSRGESERRIVYGGRLRGAPVPVKGVGIDTSDYNVLALIKYPKVKGFIDFTSTAQSTSPTTICATAASRRESHR